MQSLNTSSVFIKGGVQLWSQIYPVYFPLIQYRISFCLDCHIFNSPCGIFQALCVLGWNGTKVLHLHCNELPAVVYYFPSHLLLWYKCSYGNIDWSVILKFKHDSCNVSVTMWYKRVLVKCVCMRWQQLRITVPVYPTALYLIIVWGRRIVYFVSEWGPKMLKWWCPSEKWLLIQCTLFSRNQFRVA